MEIENDYFPIGMELKCYSSTLKIYVPYYIELHLRKLHPFWVMCSNFEMHQKQNTNMVENKSRLYNLSA
jgi:hypothetical protein